MGQKDVSAIVSGMGFALGFLTALDKERKKLGVSDADFHEAIKDESPLIGKFASMIAESCRPKLLELVSTTTISATAAKFVAREKFVIGTDRDASVKISYLGDNFRNWFLNGDGKVEEPIDEQALHYHALKHPSVDGPIIAELGGEVKAETTLTEIFVLMAKQPKGEAGVLLVKGYANIFYVRDQNEVLRAVNVLWIVDGWNLIAFSIEYPDGWFGGFQVFSRNS